MDYLDVSTMQRIAPQDPRLPVVFKQLVQRYQLSQGRLQLFRQTHNVLNRVSHQYVPGTPVKLLGSVHNHTALDDSDCDFMWMNDAADECTRNKRKQVAETVAATLEGEPELRRLHGALRVQYEIGAKATTFELWAGGSQPLAEFDLVFAATTFAGPSLDKPVPVPTEQACQAVRGIKLLQRARAAAGLATLKGYKCELLACLAHQRATAASRATGFGVFHEAMLLLIESMEQDRLHDLERRAAELCPFPLGSFLRAGQLENWANHARNVLRLLHKYNIKSVEDLEDLEVVWSGRLE